MITIHEMRLHIARLDSAERHFGYLYEIFMYFRAHSASKMLQELGDLLAHPEKRTKGSFVADTIAIDISMRLQIANIPGSPRLRITKKQLVSTIESNIKRADKDLFSKCGISEKRLHKIVKLIRKDLDNPGLSFLSDSEAGAVMTFASSIIVKPTFVSDDVLIEFQSALKTFGRITTDLAKDTRTYITLFILSKIHRTELSLEDGRNARICIMDNKGYLCCRVLIEDLGPKKFTAAYEIFATSLETHSHCPAILGTDFQWTDVAVEVTKDLMLVPYL